MFAKSIDAIEGMLTYTLGCIIFVLFSYTNTQFKYGEAIMRFPTINGFSVTISTVRIH